MSTPEFRIEIDWTPEVHKERHVALHKALDELVADWLNQTNRLPSKASVTELIQWSFEQTINPTTRGER